MFGTKGTTVEEGNGNSPRPYFKPGIHVAKIVGVEYAETQGGTPKIMITFEGKPHGGDFVHPKGAQYKGSLATTDLWLTENAMEITNQTLAYMADTLGFRDKLDAITSDSGEEYAAKLLPLLAGVVGRWKFAGEEIKNNGVGDDGEPLSNWFKTKLARYRFVEDPKVPEASTKLTFDENNNYDVKRLEQTDGDIVDDALDTAMENAAIATATSDDEPW